MRNLLRWSTITPCACGSGRRGSGETWACGTGACAAAVAAVENGYCPKDEDITVKLRGGDLIIRYTDKAVYMTGSAQTVYEGTITL